MKTMIESFLRFLIRGDRERMSRGINILRIDPIKDGENNEKH